MVSLGSLNLKAVQKLDVTEERHTIQHSTPSSGGEILQDLGRKRTQIVLEGVFSGKDGKNDVSSLVQILRKGESVPFSAETVAVYQVIVRKVKITQDQGYENLYRYYVELEEWETLPPSSSSGSGQDDATSVAIAMVTSNVNKMINEKAQEAMSQLFG